MPIPVTADPSYKRIPRSDLHPFQGELKELQRDEYDKLKASIEAEGFFEPVEIWTDEAGKHWIIDGHQRLFVCEKEGWELGDDIPTRPMPADDREHAARRLLALNSRFGRMTGQGLYEFMHSFEIDPSELDKFSLSDIDMDSFKLEFFEDNQVPPGDEDAVPEVPEDPTSRLGDLWLLGEHRVLCGDCTTPTDIQRVLNGCTVNLLHADPPYGMGKENDGVENDNLYKEKLDAFLMDFWTTALPHLDGNSSAYIWGEAESLWRLWYVGGLRDSARLTLRNEIVWNKGSGQGMNSDQHRMYPTASERCLFFMLGAQEMSENAEDYWDGWESIRLYLLEQRNIMGWDVPTMKRIVGHSDQSRDHWTSKSQWTFPTEDVYNAMREACRVDDSAEYSAFKKEYSAFKKEYSEIKKEYMEKRAYFDNIHDSMTDVWDFPRVAGGDRPDHPTPKPIDVLSRILLSSCPPEGLILDPFLGAGPSVIAAEKTGRTCYGTEIAPQYVDVIVKRWQDYTGKDATLDGDGRTFNEIANGTR
jgi:DNA modification methylase